MTDINLEAALEYAGRGWRVIPVLPGDKRPSMSRWQDHATTDLKIVRQWWTGSYEGHGVGIATGPGSGVFVLDVDVAGGKSGAESLADLVAKHGELPETKTSITGSGGTHYLYAWPDGVDVRNDAGTRLGQDLDVRGDGGFIVAPPTVHPNGTRYAWDVGQPDTIEEAPAWLLELLKPVERPISTSAPSEAVGDRPGDLWAATVTWSDLLLADGWTLGHVDRQGEHHWVRPGKTAREGTSATTGYTDANTLKVFTSSMQHAGLMPEEAYTKLGYLAATKHDGDLSAAAKWCAAQGHTTYEEDPLADLLVPARTENGTSSPIEDAGPARPLAERRTLPPWPVEILPSWLADHVKASARLLITPPDLLAQFGLGALAAVCMGHVEVTVPGVGWTEPVNLYLWCALHSGAGKSPAEKAIMGPLRKWERQRQEDTKDAYTVAKRQWSVLQKQAKEIEQSVVMGTKGMDELNAAAIAAAEDPPVRFRLTADDATPQVLVQLLGAHKRMALISSEADVFDQVASQFGKNASSTNVAVYLKAWSGDAIQRDRVGGDAGGESVVIDNPLLTMSLAIQPSVIEKYQNTSPELRGRGFFARFMPSIPHAVQGTRKLDIAASSRNANPVAEARYATELAKLASAMATTLDVALHLDAEAAAMFEAWYNAVEADTQVNRPLHSLSEMAPKIRSSVLRVAALLTLADGEMRAVDVDHLARAIKLGAYWIEHALEMERTSDPMDQIENEDVLMANLVVDWARRAYLQRNVTEFTPRDVYRGVRRSPLEVDKVEDLAPAFALLRDRGWITLTAGAPDDIGVRGAVVRAVLTRTALAQMVGITDSGGNRADSARTAAPGAYSLYTYFERSLLNSTISDSDERSHRENVPSGAVLHEVTNDPIASSPVEAGAVLAEQVDAEQTAGIEVGEQGEVW